MRKIFMVGISAMVLAATILVLLWRPGDEQPVGDVPVVVEPPASDLPDRDVAPPVFSPDMFPESASEDALDTEQAWPDDSLPEDPTELSIDSHNESEESAEVEPSRGHLSAPDMESTVLVNISGAFFDDLAGQLVAGYHPPRSQDNPDAQGLLMLSFSAVNRRYGVDLIGLDHQSPNLLQGREEIFRNLLQPDTLEMIRVLFTPMFLESLHDALQDARRTFPAGNARPETRGLSAQEQEEFHRLLSNFFASLAQGIRGFVDHEAAVVVTGQWLQAQVTAYAAHSRYQQAEVELGMAQQEQVAEQVDILAARLERDAAAKGIMQAIAAREQARERLLAMFGEGPARPALVDAELIYLSEWLWRRLHAHPDRRAPIRIVADNLEELSRQLPLDGQSR
ncbi:MAG: hypothetical protein EA399_01440 [Desulfovibrionales bacterium]|nr:MAG: hypothetical protein EA399_01440 [Desulfovibrionales bacterium]